MKKNFLLTTVVVVAFGLVTGFGNATEDSKVGGAPSGAQAQSWDESLLYRRILEANQVFMEVFSTRDAEAMADLYTEDAILLAPDLPPFEGREGIIAFMQSGFDSGLSAIDLETVEVVGHGYMAHELGIYTLYATVGEETVFAGQGYYQVIWKRERGQWKLHRDVITTSTPSSLPTE